MKEKMESLRAGIASGDPSARCDALAGLRHLAGRGDSEALVAALSAAEDEIPQVREAAILTIRALCPSGQCEEKEQAQTLVMKSLKDENTQVQLAALASLKEVGITLSQVMEQIEIGLSSETPVIRRAALAAISQLGTKGDAELVEKAVPLTKDADPLVRAHALNTLRLIAEHGNPIAIKAAAKRLCDEDSVVKRVSISTLQELAEKGNKRALEAVSGWLDDADLEVRAQGVDALALFAEKGNEDAVKALSRLVVSDSEKRVAARAVSALGKIANPGDSVAIQASLQAFKSPHSRVRETAAATLSLIALPGDHVVIAKLAHMLLDPAECVRLEASACFQTLAGVDGYGVAVLVDMLLQNNKKTTITTAAATTATSGGEEEEIHDKQASSANSSSRRQALVEALAAISHAKDERARSALLSILSSDNDDDVWWSAFQALLTIAGPSDEQVIESVAGHLRHESASMRRLAVSALKELADRGNEETARALVRAAMEHVADAESFVRFEVFESMKVMAHVAGDTAGAVEMLANGLRDEDEQVRGAARKALKAIAKRSAEKQQLVIRHCLQVSDQSESENNAPAWAAGLRSLASVTTEKGSNDKVIDAVKRGLESAHSEVRERAIKAAVSVALPSDELVISALIKRLEDEQDAMVRCAAVVALETVSLEDQNAANVTKNSQVITAIAGRLEDEDDGVRMMAVAALTHLGREATFAELAQEAITSRLEHSRPQVRTAAVQVLRNLATSDESLAPVSVHTPVDSEVTYRRLFRDLSAAVSPRHTTPAAAGAAAAATTETLKSPGTTDPSHHQQVQHGRAIDLLAVRMKDAEPHVRQEAVAALRYVASQGEERAMDLAVDLLDDSDAAVRLGAVGVVGALGASTSDRSLEALKKCLGDQDADVRRCAWSWLLEAHGRHAEMESMVSEWDVAGPFSDEAEMKSRRQSWPATHDPRSAVYEQPSSPRHDEDD